MNNRHLYWLASVLTACALSVFLYKILVLRFPVLPDRLATAWQLEARIDFMARGDAVQVEFVLPRSTPSQTVFNESFVGGGYGRITRTVGDDREAVFSAARATGEQVLFYRTTLELTDTNEAPPTSPAPRLVRRPMSEAHQAAAKAILDRTAPRAAGTATLVALLIQELRNARPGDEAMLFLDGDVSDRRVTDTAAMILRFAGIPARRVNGLPLMEDRREAPLAHWLEVYTDDRWMPFQASDGLPGAPPQHMVWWRGERPPLRITGGNTGHLTFSVSTAYQLAIRAAIERGRAAGASLIEFSLFDLPFPTQQVYRILLVVPVGIFLLVVLRNVVGIRTFGTFMPVLIALAFRETRLLWGVGLFALVVFLGISVRFYLEHLKLLLVPRLASIVIVVIGVMAALSILSFKLGIERGLSVALFPIVILTMTIERMTVVWEEHGPRESLIQAAGSLAVAVVCYLVMNAQPVQHLAFVFPELLLMVLAATLLLGRYSGYRLTELVRFRALAGGDKP